MAMWDGVRITLTAGYTSPNIPRRWLASDPISERKKASNQHTRTGISPHSSCQKVLDSLQHSVYPDDRSDTPNVPDISAHVNEDGWIDTSFH